MFKNLAVWLVIGMVMMTVFNQFNSRQAPQASMEYSQFLDEVGRGTIKKVVIEGRVLKATTNDGRKITTYAPPDLWMVSDLLKNNVQVEAKPEEEQSFLISAILNWFPMLLLIGVWIFFMRQMQSGGGKAMEERLAAFLRRTGEEIPLGLLEVLRQPTLRFFDAVASHLQQQMMFRMQK